MGRGLRRRWLIPLTGGYQRLPGANWPGGSGIWQRARALVVLEMRGLGENAVSRRNKKRPPGFTWRDTEFRADQSPRARKTRGLPWQSSAPGKSTTPRGADSRRVLARLTDPLDQRHHQFDRLPRWVIKLCNCPRPLPRARVLHRAPARNQRANAAATYKTDQQQRTLPPLQ
jgi:hypothetical protein